MASRDSAFKTFAVATALCLVCSTLVSTAAVALKDRYEANKALEKKRIIVSSSKLLDEKAFAELVKKDDELKKFYTDNIQAVVIDLDTGEAVSKDVLDPATYNQMKAPKDPEKSTAITEKVTYYPFKTREKYSVIYVAKDGDQVKRLILPVYGKGLWSTMYGFLAVENDTSTVKALAFYQHAETPGLGGEVDNKRWKADWDGKQIYNLEEETDPSKPWKPVNKVIKGKVNRDNPEAKYQVDGLAGATITSNGVTGLVHYWMGEHGYGSFLAKYRENGEKALQAKGAQ